MKRFIIMRETEGGEALFVSTREPNEQYTPFVALAETMELLECCQFCAAHQDIYNELHIMRMSDASLAKIEHFATYKPNLV